MGVTFINLARCHCSLGAIHDATKDTEMLGIQDQSTLWSKKLLKIAPWYSSEENPVSQILPNGC